MSRIFDVARKDGLIDFEDIARLSGMERGSPQSISESAQNALWTNLAPPPAIRTLSLVAPKNSPLLAFDSDGSILAEQYRIIRTKLRSSARPCRLIAVSSSSSGDGKTVTSVNLAASLSLKDNFRVLLVDADLHRSSIAGALDIPSSPGLTDVVGDASNLDAALVRAEQFPNLFLLPAGAEAKKSTELLDSERWRRLITEVRARFDCVIFDAPPVGAVADYDLLEQACDGVVMVLRPGHSSRKACMQAFESVCKEKLLGVVLNAVENSWLWRGVPETYGTR